MNIITNNCLGGFIYRDILKTEYQNPFIWTGIEIEKFIDFVDNFDKIDFTNVMIEKEGEGLKNNFFTVIDDKYKFRNGHIVFNKNDNVPRIMNDSKHLDWVNVYYNRPWEYILEKYNKRVKRMDNNIIVAIYAKDNEFTDQLNKLADVCLKYNYPCLIFHSEKIKENLVTKSYVIKHKEPWIDNLYKHYRKEIEEFINENRDNNDKLD